jgi:prolipoprotein diacylglyceryltransferase
MVRNTWYISISKFVSLSEKKKAYHSTPAIIKAFENGMAFLGNVVGMLFLETLFDGVSLFEHTI